MSDLAVTVEGSRPAASALAATPVFLGYRIGTNPPSGFDYDFVDWPFRAIRAGDLTFGQARERMRTACEAHRPRIAVAPDITGNISAANAYTVADELLEHARDVVVTPKQEVKPVDVPDRFRVGLPTQQSWGTAPYSITEYARLHDVHVLGGSPNAQLDRLNYVPGASSFDSASIIRQSFRGGQIWAGDKWLDWPFDGAYARITISARLYAHQLGMRQLGGSKLLGGLFSGETTTTPELIEAAYPTMDDVRETVRAVNPEFTIDTVARDSLLVTAPASATGGDPADELTTLLGEDYTLDVEATRGATTIQIDGVRRPPSVETIGNKLDAALRARRADADDPAQSSLDGFGSK